MAATREGRNARAVDLGHTPETLGAGEEQALGHRLGRAAPGPGPRIRPGHRGGGAGLPGGEGCGSRHGRHAGRPRAGRTWRAHRPRRAGRWPERGTGSRGGSRTVVPSRKSRGGPERRSPRPAPAGIGPRPGRGGGIPRAFLPDAAAIGTTLLAAAPGHELRPAFGEDSRARHRESGAVELCLDEVDSVRQDVDTGEDLRAALALGVGSRTAAAAARLLIAPHPNHNPS